MVEQLEVRHLVLHDVVEDSAGAISSRQLKLIAPLEEQHAQRVR